MTVVLLSLNQYFVSNLCGSQTSTCNAVTADEKLVQHVKKKKGPVLYRLLLQLFVFYIGLSDFLMLQALLFQCVTPHTTTATLFANSRF